MANPERILPIEDKRVLQKTVNEVIIAKAKPSDIEGQQAAMQRLTDMLADKPGALEEIILWHRTGENK